jgi:hypothetical protein
MTGHDAIGIYFQPFFFLAELNAFIKNIPVRLTNININPVNNCKCHKIDLFLVPEYIFSSHILINIKY